jgi:hypothetical protein
MQPTPQQRPIRRLLIVSMALYFVSVVVRVLYLYSFVQMDPLTVDEPEYYEPARHLAAGEGYLMVGQQSHDGVPRPTAYRTPIPAMIIAIPFAIFGPSPELARWICLLIASLSSPLVYLLGRRIGPPTPAFLAGLFCSLYPTWIYYSSMILSEAFYMPALVGMLMLTDTLTRSTSRWRWLVLGLAWGLLTLIRPHALPCCGLITLYLLFQCSFSRVLLIPLGMALVLSPWMVRNLVQLGHPVFLATEGGETFLGANNPDILNDPFYSGMWKSPMIIPEYRDRLYPIQDEVERDREQTRMGIEFLRSHPSAIPGLVFRKIWRWLTPVTNTGGIIRIGVMASYGLLLLLLLIGLVQRSFTRSRLLVQVMLITVASCIITAVYWGNLTRGRLPIEIIWLPWGCLAGWNCAVQIRRSASGSVARQTNLTKQAVT